MHTKPNVISLEEFRARECRLKVLAACAYAVGLAFLALVGVLLFIVLSMRMHGKILIAYSLGGVVSVFSLFRVYLVWAEKQCGLKCPACRQSLVAVGLRKGIDLDTGKCRHCGECVVIISEGANED